MRIFKVRRMNNISLGEKYIIDREYSLDGIFDDRTKDIIKLELRGNEDFIRKIDDYLRIII